MNTARVGRPRGENVENANRRRRQILDAAVSSIVEHGLSSTTLATVARASGLSQSTAVFYFKNKETLLSEAFLHRMEAYRANWTEALASAGNDPVDRIIALTFASLDPRVLSHHDLAFWNTFWPEACRSENLNAISEEYEAERQAILKSLCAEAEAVMRGTLWTPHAAAQAIENMVEGVWVRLHYSSAHMSVADARLTVATLLSTIFPPRRDDIMARAALPPDDAGEQE